MSLKKIVLLSLLFVLISISYSESLKVAAVQLEISERTYLSTETFFTEMDKRIAEAVRAFQPDLIIFPEYVSVFPAITPYLSYTRGQDSIEDIFTAIRKDHQNIRSIRDLFVAESERMEELMDRWGDLSQKYGLYILGGSYFAYSQGNLTNQLAIYGPEGNRAYSQDKFFLTDFETDIVGLSPGSSETPDGITIKGKHIVFTICRDTFLRRWEYLYDGADLWIDIKANGETYGDEQVGLFSRALPARLEQSDVPYGATVCLTGRFLELFWEGESSFFGKSESGVNNFIRSESPDKEDILYFIID